MKLSATRLESDPTSNAMHNVTRPARAGLVYKNTLIHIIVHIILSIPYIINFNKKLICVHRTFCTYDKINKVRIGVLKF